MIVSALVSIVLDLRVVTAICTVGGTGLAFVGGYLMRADFVATGRRPPRFLIVSTDVPRDELVEDGFSPVKPTSVDRRRVGGRLLAVGAAGLVAGILAALAVDPVVGLAIGVGAVLIPGGTWLLLRLDERGGVHS